MFYIFILLINLTAFSTQANGVSPYLPLKTDSLIELEIERLASIAQMPMLSKPYHIATVVKYLSKVQDSHPQLYSRLTHYIKRFKKQSGVTQYSIELSAGSGDNKTLANKRGTDVESFVQASFASFYQYNSHLIFNAGGSYIKGEGYVPHNSYISFGQEYLQVDIGYREHWLSGNFESSLLLSTNAKPIAAVTVSNVKPITDFNFRYELSYGKIETQQGINFDGKKSSGKPGFLTMHFSMQPFNWWTIAGNRTMMFGGGNRDTGISDIWAAIVDPLNNDNCGSTSDLKDCKKEVGNQIASISNKFDLQLFDVPFTLFYDYGAEDTGDESGNGYTLGNLATSAAIFFPYVSEDIAFFAEYTKFHSAWYVHHIYDEGYTNRNHVIGHWWGDNKNPKDGTPGKSAMIKVNWDINNSNHLEVVFRAVKNQDSFIDYQTAKELEVNIKHAYQDGFLGLSLNAGKDVYGESFYRAAVNYQW